MKIQQRQQQHKVEMRKHEKQRDTQKWRIGELLI